MPHSASGWPCLQTGCGRCGNAATSSPTRTRNVWRLTSLRRCRGACCSAGYARTSARCATPSTPCRLNFDSGALLPPIHDSKPLVQRSTTMDVLRTPDERFAGLPDFPFAPHYVEVDSGDGGKLRMHYLDEGPSDGEVVLLLHGEPSWSYLYRWMIPVLADAGLRAMALDLVGFGRSDKPTSRDDYTYQAHVEWTRAP